MTRMNYRYYEDTYGNQYRWTISPDADGKYSGRILKIIKHKYLSPSWQTSKIRTFKLRRKAKSWCMLHAMEAKKRQDSVLNRREIRRVIRQEAKPVFTKEELKMKKLESDIARADELSQKWIRKVKFANTMLKGYDKKINRLRKQHLKLTTRADVL